MDELSDEERKAVTAWVPPMTPSLSDLFTRANDRPIKEKIDSGWQDIFVRL